jgi:hypothetical protein
VHDCGVANDDEEVADDDDGEKVTGASWTGLS